MSEWLVARHWLLHRDDPRTVLVGSAFVLGCGVFFASMGTGIPTTFMAIWIVVAIGQTLYALIQVRRMGDRVRAGAGDEAGGPSSGPSW
jgi:hypothetical protein